MQTNNPLLANTNLPLFQQIKPEHIEPALDQVLAENRARIAALLSDTTPKNYDALVLPLETLDNHLHKVWSPVTHLHSVQTSDELRKAYHACIPKITAYVTELEQNESLYNAFQQLAESTEFLNLNKAQQKVIEDQLEDFRLSGVMLPSEQKKRYAEIQTLLAKLTTKFEENVLDATDHWHHHVTSRNELEGLADYVIDEAEKTAKQKNLTGYVLTLEEPCYFAVMSYAKNRELRQIIYTAYCTRASDQGPNAGTYDNLPVMTEILALRHELSLLLGFKNFAELSLARKMVKQPVRVMNFLDELATKAHKTATHEYQELKNFAKSLDNIDELQTWDITYYREKLSKSRFTIDDETLRPYFPVDHVLASLFKLMQKIYKLEISANTENNLELWHPDVKFYNIYDATKTLRGQFYLDLYARPRKRGGAWMDDCLTRFRSANGALQTPVAYLVCNLTPPAANKNTPALLSHDEVITLFHEFGHGLHHMLSQIDYLSVSGTNGVEWDAVELPSQLNEFFAWEKPVLHFLSQHHETKQPLSDELIDRMIEARNFHSGLKVARQLEFAIFDFQLHLNFDPQIKTNQIQNTLDTVREKISVTQIPTWNRFPNSFGHIFSGGYAAGYYSYLWAEMLACDAFAKFKEDGVISDKIGQEFLSCILEKGGSEKALDLFVRFRGREPHIDALLEHLGLA